MVELVSIGYTLAFCIAGFFAFGIFMRFMMGRQRRNVLLNFRHELNTLRWIGADDGWDCAIEAVRKRLLELSESLK